MMVVTLRHRHLTTNGEDVREKTQTHLTHRGWERIRERDLKLSQSVSWLRRIKDHLQLDYRKRCDISRGKLSIKRKKKTQIKMNNRRKNIMTHSSPSHAVGVWKRRFYSENASIVFRPHYAGGIWKRNNHQAFRIYVWGKLGQSNHVIIVTSSFSFSWQCGR